MSEVRDPPTLLCWHSVGHGLAVVRHAVALLRTQGIEIARVHYLTDGGSDVREAAVSAATGVCDVALQSIALDGPTNHASIYRAVCDEVVPRVSRCRALHINVSPGTPAMHAVWLVLHAGGAFPAGTKLWSSQRDRDGGQRIEPVAFTVRTYLAEIRDVQRRTPEDPTYDAEPRSPARRRFLDTFRRYAAVPGAPVLVLGERGTGKTRLVETYVAGIRRRAVTTLACGALDSADPRLAESELFGYEAGAFTGATKARSGLLDAADGAVLFLDEVQDLPRALQRKLVQLLQGSPRRYRRVGGVRERTVDVDIVCASNLADDALADRLDADLLDRVGLLSVRVPPLRACREDLADDWQRVWHATRRGEGIPQGAPMNAALRARLREDPLPGNLRDLQALALRVMAWWPERGEDALDSALDEWTTRASAADSVRAMALGEGSRKDRIAAFRGALAREARARYGSWQRAAEALACDEKTLRDDEKG